MNQYATSEYYYEIFKGNVIQSEDINRCLQEATEKIRETTEADPTRICFG